MPTADLRRWRHTSKALDGCGGPKGNLKGAEKSEWTHVGASALGEASAVQVVLQSAGVLFLLFTLCGIRLGSSVPVGRRSSSGKNNQLRLAPIEYAIMDGSADVLHPVAPHSTVVYMWSASASPSCSRAPEPVRPTDLRRPSRRSRSRRNALTHLLRGSHTPALLALPSDLIQIRHQSHPSPRLLHNGHGQTDHPITHRKSFEV